MESDKRVVCVVGPTGCGKTELGVRLCEELGGEVVSCDSMQLYRGMVIGTAAPTPEEMRGIPHHMVGVADPHEDYSVARFGAEAGDCAENILRRGKLPVIVGGTGLYLDALLRGQAFGAGSTGGRIRIALEERLAAEGSAALHRELALVDPDAAVRLHENDAKRIVRALEVYAETGITITQFNERSRTIPPRFSPVYIGLAYADREEMKRRIDRRVDGMVSAGLFAEVRALLDAGVPRSATAMQAIGYKECLAALDGLCSEAEAVAEIKLRSRQYAKRQLTWLRRNDRIHWFYWEKERDFVAATRFSTEILQG